MNCSVLINNYNNGPYLRACLDSVIGQLSGDDEVIVYDDGSSDDSRAILTEYGNRIESIFAEKLELPYRKCQAIAIDQAFRLSRGDYIFLLDGDDLFLPGKLTAYLEAFADPAVTMVQGAMLQIGRDGEPIGDKRHEWAHGIDTSQQVLETQDLDFFYPTSSLALRRTVLEEVLPLKLNDFPAVSADIALSIAAVVRGQIVTLDENYTAWRQHRLNHSDRFTEPFHRLKFDLQIARYYNEAAARIGKVQTVHPWRNPKIYRRTARHIASDILKIG
jgi:glycosyltransferase involved in cell wall biosynthesis